MLMQLSHRKTSVALTALILVSIAAVVFLIAAPASPQTYVNSVEIKMIQIPGGSFPMGNEEPTDAKVLKQSSVITHGDYDERPVHEVRITYDFYMSETEITAKQYSKIHNDFQGLGLSIPYATGMSWEDAVAFCNWLSRTEGKTYRLPTEAELGIRRPGREQRILLLG